MPSLNALSAVSSVDGRYRQETEGLSGYFSEAALICHRLRIENKWLERMIPFFAPELADKAKPIMDEIDIAAGTISVAEAVKKIEKKTRHDVKAVEYWLAGKLEEQGLAKLRPFVHFGCTSWDINNLAMAQITDGAVKKVMLPELCKVLDELRENAQNWANYPMLSRTHGQPASPTTVGKEFANFAERLSPWVGKLETLQLPAKMNGAVGNYNAHVAARPDIDWQQVTQKFVENFGFRFATHTTQIEPYDDLADLFDKLCRVNNILLDLSRDLWEYIAMDYFRLKTEKEAVGSSTMPHKINPIDFENAEGKLGVANALLRHFSDKLPVSRLQRDLSDSTVLRDIGTAFAATLIAWRAIARGLDKIELNHERLQADLDNNWQVLAEAAMSAMRAAGEDGGYEMLKEFSRGVVVSRKDMQDMFRRLPIGEEAKERLLRMTPATYIGLAAKLAKTS